MSERQISGDGFMKPGPDYPYGLVGDPVTSRADIERDTMRPAASDEIKLSEGKVTGPSVKPDVTPYANGVREWLIEQQGLVGIELNEAVDRHLGRMFPDGYEITRELGEE